MSGQTIDLNADLGEGGDFDAALFPLISSANIACGGHAGDSDTMQASVTAAIAHGVAIGAHPGLMDRAGFGRSWIATPGPVLQAQVSEQITLLRRVCTEHGVNLSHVKAHGALYNRAAVDELVATVVAKAIIDVDSALRIFVQPHSVMERVATGLGLTVVREAFADRAYNLDGTLVSREIEGAVLHDPATVAARVVSMVRTGSVPTIDGQVLPLVTETICLHSDTPGAVAIARAIRAALADAGIAVEPVR
jgi:UPF0271 protein